jgi:hypothetical protein
MLATGPVDVLWVRPDSEIAHVQDPIESNAEAAFECEDVIIQARQSAMNVPSRANKHYRPPPFGSYIADAIDAYSTQLLIV